MEEELDDLDDIIRWLEKEYNRLKECVTSASEDGQFKQAKSYAKAYARVGTRLRVLKNLRDPGFDERARLYRRLVWLEEQQQKFAKISEIASHYQREIDDVNLELDRLEHNKRTPIDTQYIDDALFDLVQGRILNFKLHLNKDEELSFDFLCVQERLHITFSYKKGALMASIKKRFRSIGFSKTKGERKFTRTFDVSQFKDAQSIKQFLALAILDVLGTSWIENPQIEIIHLPGNKEH